MLILLPPSETKRDGGVDGSRLRLAALGFPSLAAPRREAIASLTGLAKNFAEMARALRLGPHQQAELERNRRLRRSAVLPALDRYTGVLYEALAAHTLTDPAREFAAQHLVIHSALFGLLRSGDEIPAYRLSHDSRLPGLQLGKLWRSPISAVLGRCDGLVLDFRSEAYARLGPAGDGSFFLRAVAEDERGRRRALGHFNKQGKGLLSRALLQAGIDHPDLDSLLDWARDAGFRLSLNAARELELVV